jgi:hypothetical protein
MKHPGHMYGGFIPAISERGVTVTHHLPEEVEAWDDNKDMAYNPEEEVHEGKQ